MKPLRVIPCKVWRHKLTKRTASIYGANPCSGLPGDMRQDWDIVQVGWTTQNDNGTTGLGIRPFATAEGVQEHIKKHWGLDIPIER